MSSLFNDRPHRKALITGSPADRDAYLQVYLFTKPTFFCKRDRDMKPEKDVSQKVIKAVAAKGAHCVILVTEEDDWMKKDLVDAGFELFYINATRPVVSAKSLKNHLTSLGVRFSFMKDPRQVTWLNMSKYAVNNSLLCIRPDDYEILDIQPDKEVTFQDMANERKSGAWL